MYRMQGSPEPLPREQTTIRQWCRACQACTPSVIIEGTTFCARCEPGGLRRERCEAEAGLFAQLDAARRDR